MDDEEMWFVVVNCPNEEVADAIGRAAMASKLARSFNVGSPMRTMYEWRGDVVANTEVQLIFKVRGPALTPLTELVASRHPFDTPAIVGWRIDHALPAYRAYVHEQPE